jgi:hypothetical protein
VTVSPAATPAWRMSWTDAGPFDSLTPGSVIITHNHGNWRVTATAGGGVDVEQDVHVVPGGHVPSWVINWFQTFGVSEAMKKLHDLAARS